MQTLEQQPIMTYSRFLRANAFRLLVLAIVFLAISKLILQNSSTSVGQIPRMEKGVEQKVEKAQPPGPDEANGLFWGKRRDSDSRKGEVPELPPEPIHEDNTLVKGDAPAKKNRVPAKDMSRKQMRLVHLDLKGAPPQISYFEQVFPLFAKLGANGLLIEYEDMFPFQGELEILRSPYAYSEEDIDKILHLAAINGLEVVPLVQTFGHMEYVLKYSKYRHLREVEKYPNSLNPHSAETLPLVTMILSQVLEKHPKVTWFHIGADEVFYLGEGQDSKAWMNKNEGDLGKMFLNHMKAVLDFLVTNYKGVQWLMWDDMLRRIKVEAIKESGITKHTAPMIWLYRPDMDVNNISQHITKYQDCGFKTVWFASAFKGATSVATVWTPMEQRQKNHQGWVQMLQPSTKAKYPDITFQGIALTGWQRYDHFSALCELLPVGIPSLAVCLQTLVHGGFTAEAKKNVVEMLGFQDIDLSKNNCVVKGGFPGSEIYQMVKMIDSELKPKVEKLLNDPRQNIAGWFSHYHRKHRFGNPYKMELFGSKVLTAHEELESQIQKLRGHLEAIYFPDTVEEWMEEYVNPYMDPLRQFVNDYQKIVKLNAQPKDPQKKL